MRKSALLGLLLLACDDAPGGGGHGSAVGGAAGEASALQADAGAPDEAETPEGARYVGLSDSFMPFALGEGNGGEGGAAPELPLGPPHGTSTTCGDAIVGDDEECDDGAGGADGCTAECQTQDQPGGPPSATPDATNDRYLGAGRHPVSGLEHGFITTYVDAAGDEPAIGARLFNIWGQPAHDVSVSEGASPIYEANPVAAALPGGRYAVAWGDFDGDGSDLGVALRLVDEDGTLGSLRSANAATEFSQLNPDVLWTGSELVVAWEDYSDASNGPDLRFRTFNEDLDATSSDGTLAESVLPEAAVALAPFNGGWVAAYREGLADGRENVVVKVGQTAFRMGPLHGGPIDDRPALVELDDTHLLVVFTVGTDPTNSGVYNQPRLRYAVIDTAEGALPPTVRPIEALDDMLSSDLKVAQMSPALASGNDGPYLAWRSEARPGDASGDEVWLKRLSWTQTGSVWGLNSDLPEMLIPRTCDGAYHDQRSPALATVKLPPGNALAIAWTDYGKTLGAGAGEPDVVVHYAPTHLASTTGAPQSLTETWSGPTGSALPSRWTTDVAPPGTWTQQYGEAELGSVGAPVTSFALVSDHTAKNVDIVTTLRMGYPHHEGIVARADGLATPQNYLAAVITTQKATTWRVYSVVNGVVTNLLTHPIPKSFYDSGIGANVDHRLRFRAMTNPDGTLFLGMKVWRVGAAEPANWLVSTSPSLPVTHPTVQALGNVAGRFGVFGSVLTANGGRMNFDDFRASFFEGSAGGDLDVVPNQYSLLLRRDVATYRQCSPESPCVVTTGCCTGDADCESGLACSRWQSEGLGEGSHSAVCVAEHCANSINDSDEVRADCGGADCKPCDCTSTVALGATGYCSSSCSCGVGEYPCALNAGCLPGLICGKGTAELHGGAYGVSACVPPHCMNRIKDADEVKPDCGGACGGGDCSNVCPQPNGSDGHCRPYCVCGTGHGNCAQDDDCLSGLVCAFRATRYGLPSSVQVCVPPTCQNNVRDIALGETGTDCGGACGCNGCTGVCQGLPAAQGDTITIPTSTPHTESFDGIGNADVATLPVAWRIDKQANPRTLGTYGAAGTTTLARSGAAMDSNATNSIYNFGAGVAATGPGYWLDSTDRALGWLATGAQVSHGGTKSGNLYVQLQAPVSTDINGLTVSYTVEKYRGGTTAPGWKVQLYYSLDGTNWASAGSAFTTSFSNDAQANGYDPAPGSTTSVSGTIPPYVLKGNPLYLAWNYTTSSAASVDATSAQALAIDDVSIIGAVSQ